ncbi:MAG: copper-transporting P-type ATPase [Opitutales bacterium]
MPDPGSEPPHDKQSSTGRGKGSGHGCGGRQDDSASGPVGRAWYCPMCSSVESDDPGDCPTCGMALERNPAVKGSRTSGYTCPMHPEVFSEEPGTCPQCGMDLEPASPGRDENAEAVESRRMTRRFQMATALAVPVLVLAMGPMAGIPLDSWLPPTLNHWLQALLSGLVIVFPGRFVFQRAWQSVRSVNPNMWTLIGLGTLAAFGFSLLALLADENLPAAFREGDHPPVYFESAAVILALVILGQMLEARARSRTGDALKALINQSPREAHQVDDAGNETTIGVDAVQAGDRLRVRPGESVPVDGKVVEGESRIDTSMITGEPDPVRVETGDAVTGGTINQSGSFLMEAEHVGADTLLSRIIDRVAEAQRSRAPIQSVADRVAAVFVPAVVGVSILAFIIWAWWGPEPALAYAVVNAVAVLIIACPCALGLATPISIMVGVGRGASQGILIRDAEALQVLERVNLLLVDKTGTLTEGKPRVTDLRPVGDHRDEDLLRLVAAAESSSEHPLARSIVEAAEDRDLDLPESCDFASQTGRGITARVKTTTLHIGKRAFIEDQLDETDSLDELKAVAADWEQAGKTVVWVAIDGRPGGLISVADPIKETTPQALQTLRALDIEVRMLTGDQPDTAKAIARRLGIDGVEAGLSPEDKQACVNRARKEGYRVAMAGDGINDAPALAAADVGIAMGTGTDVAIESAGISLVRGDLRSIEQAVLLSRATLRNIRQNLFFAFVYNGLGVPLAAGLLYPVSGILLSPMIAAAAMSLSSVSVIGNALRLRKCDLGGNR